MTNFHFQNFPGAAILNNCDVLWLPCNNWATTARHNFSRRQRPENLKAKTSVFEHELFEKLETRFIVKIMFCNLKPFFSCFSGGFL